MAIDTGRKQPTTSVSTPGQPTRALQEPQLPANWQEQVSIPRISKYIPHHPHPRQLAFLSPAVNSIEEVLFGGAAGGGKCLTPDHQVLTRSGWRLIADVQPGEQVLSWDDGALTWQEVSHSWSYDYSGELLTFENHHVSFMATPNHKLRAYCQKRNVYWEWVQLKDVRTRLEVPASGDPDTLSLDNTYSGDLLELWGWWIAEGYRYSDETVTTQEMPAVTRTYKNGKIGTVKSFTRSKGMSNPHITYICQRNPWGKERISELCTNLGIEHWDGGDVIRARWQPPLYSGHSSSTKCIPRPLFNQVHRDRLLQGLVFGDGGPRRKGWGYSTISHQLADDVQELGVLLGYRTAKRIKNITLPWANNRPYSSYLLSGYPKRQSTIPNGRITTTQYSGPVHCLTVPMTGTFLVRRNGRVHVTGNSDALLMAALQYVDIPNYAAIIFRRSYSDLALPGAIMDRASDWLRPHNIKWQDHTKTFVFPTGNGTQATLTFGYLDSSKDKYRYQGAEFQFVGFDEATQFKENDYLYLFSRLRRLKGMEVPIRMRAASNPGGVGHEWVKRRFIDEGISQGRLFIKSLVDDNPSLDKAEYEKVLNKLDPVTRMQLRYGSWSVTHVGSMFRRSWFKLLHAEEVPPLTKVVRGWDLAATRPSPENLDPDYTVGTKVGRTAAGIYFVLHAGRTRDTPHAVEDFVAATADRDGTSIPQYIEQEPGSGGPTTVSHYRRNVLPRHPVYGVRSTGAKDVRARPASAKAQAGDIFIVHGAWNSWFLDTLEVFPQPEFHDDAVDSFTLALNTLNNKPRRELRF